MPNYQDAKIYKIVNIDNTLCYIGSTTQTLAQRRAKHISSYNLWKDGKFNFITSFKLFDDDEDAHIILLELCPCNSKMELDSRERHYIDLLQCVNKNKPGRTLKQYYVDNKEAILEQQRQYKIDNKDIINQKHREKHNCICGGKFTSNNHSTHIKTNKHLAFLENN